MDWMNKRVNPLKVFVKDNIQIEIAGIERIHRLGRIRNAQVTANRPVILKLLDYRDKVKIFKCCSKLKNSGYSISEDFSSTLKEIRKKL